ncbi:MAG: NAD-dependent epimerase/dehydratase family protein [Alkalilacustris sp.]
MEFSLRGQRVLVVGGGGFIGRHLLAGLLKAGAYPVVLDMSPRPPEVAPSLDWVTGSYLDPALLATLAASCRGVVFLANSSLPGTANSDLAAEVDAHVRSTVKAAEICCDQGVERFVYASSGGTVYGHSALKPLSETTHCMPRNAYGVSKLAIEHYLRLIAMMRPMKTVSLRIANPYGEWQRATRNQGFVAAAMQHAMAGTTMPIWGDGQVERDFIHVSDVASAFVATLAVTDPAPCLNIGSGRGVSLLAMLEDIGKALGRPVRVTFEPGRNIDVARNVLDIELAQRQLGWQPTVALPDGLTRTARWWRSIHSGAD